MFAFNMFAQARIHYLDSIEVAVGLRYSEWFEMASSSSAPLSSSEGYPPNFRQVKPLFLFLCDLGSEGIYHSPPSFFTVIAFVVLLFYLFLVESGDNNIPF